MAVSAELQTRICPDPVFIIGSPRSGSTILAWSLAQHEELWTSGESHFLWRLFGAADHLENVFRTVKNWPGGSWLYDQNVEYDEFLRYVGLGLNALFSSRSCQRRWIDQTPYYVYMAEQLLSMFPDARFLHIIRDGRKVVNSMTHFSNAFTSDVWTELLNSKQLGEWATDFRQACREWSRSVELGRLFVNQHPGISLTVSYEKLVADPDHIFTEIFAFLGVPFRPEPAHYFRSNCINSSFPKNKVAILQNRNTTDLWCDWDQDHREVFIQETGDTLLQCGMAAESDLILSDCHHSIFRLREKARKVLPPSALILVATEGHDELLSLGGRQCWHFPRTKEGGHAGHVANSKAAITHLEELRHQGAEFLVIPNSALWWLDYYVEFREHLELHYRRIWSDEDCTIFRITRQATTSVVA